MIRLSNSNTRSAIIIVNNIGKSVFIFSCKVNRYGYNILPIYSSFNNSFNDINDLSDWRSYPDTISDNLVGSDEDIINYIIGAMTYSHLNQEPLNPYWWHKYSIDIGIDDIRSFDEDEEEFNKGEVKYVIGTINPDDITILFDDTDNEEELLTDEQYDFLVE